MKDICIPAGKKLKLECTFTGSPSVFATWLKDGRQLYASDTYNTKVTKNMCILESLHESNKETCGRYSCEISNSCGTDICFAQVTVLELEHGDSKGISSDYSSDKYSVGADGLHQSLLTSPRGLCTT